LDTRRIANLGEVPQVILRLSQSQDVVNSGEARAKDVLSVKLCLRKWMQTSVRAQEDRQQQRRQDLLRMKLCLRKCICDGGASKCVWKHHRVCDNASCGVLIYPLEVCASEGCKILALAAKQAKTDARAKQDEQDLESFKLCAFWQKKPLPSGFAKVCPCTGASDQRDHIS
jgi:hypothetical protein